MTTYMQGSFNQGVDYVPKMEHIFQKLLFQKWNIVHLV